MRPDWDDDSPELRVNLARVHDSVEAEAYRRALPTVESARAWQRRIMRDLDVPDPGYVGAFRGEPGLEDCQVTVGGRWGVAADQVAQALGAFERRLQRAVAYLDALIPAGAPLSTDQGRAIIELCAWTHAEWVRIHPFANGNGRTARIWANSIAMRYGLPPFLRLRPRPAGAYGTACAQAMLGNWTPTADCFHQLLEDFPPGSRFEAIPALTIPHPRSPTPRRDDWRNERRLHPDSFVRRGGQGFERQADRRRRRAEMFP